MCYLHMVWAKFAGRADDFAAAREKVSVELGFSDRSPWLDDDQRPNKINHDLPDTTGVLEFVRRVNNELGLKSRAEWTW
jgi:hypothetical protein